MMNRETTWTMTQVLGVYSESVDVRCRSEMDGRVCGRILARNLTGTVDLKCPRCGTVLTYERNVLDKDNS